MCRGGALANVPLVGSPDLRTERLELRPVRDEDIDRILEYRNLPEVTRWLLRTVVDPVSFRAAWQRAAKALTTTAWPWFSTAR
ncbi:hypothetical protein GCM10029963_02850 [Micromonospora andamanensis]